MALTFYTIKLLIVTITKGLALAVYENLKNDNSVGYGINHLLGACWLKTIVMEGVFNHE